MVSKKSAHSCAKPLLVHRFQQSCPQGLLFIIHIVHMDSNELSTLSTGLSTTQAEFSTEQTNETGERGRYLALGPLSEGKRSAVAVVNDSPVDCQSCDRAARRRLSATADWGSAWPSGDTPSDLAGARPPEGELPEGQERPPWGAPMNGGGKRSGFARRNAGDGVPYGWVTFWFVIYNSSTIPL